MKYFIDTGVLSTDDGDYLKTLHCPLNKRWDNLVPMTDTDRKRRCNQCHKYVIDLSGYSDAQARALIEVDPHACVAIRSDADNIEFIGAGSDEDLGFLRRELCVDHDEAHPHRIIRTARNEKEIQAAQQLEGYFILLHTIKENRKIKQKIIIQFDEASGEYYFHGDTRYMGSGETVWYHPRIDTFPLAAYIVPDDIQIGEVVYIPDLIDEHVGSQWNQGDTYKMRGTKARWNGNGFDYDVPEPAMMIG